MGTINKIKQYVETWKKRGYGADIPDSAPDELMNLQLAPSYKAIAIALLHNDVELYKLGFTPKKSKWYGVLKKIEIEERNAKHSPTLNQVS